MSARIHFFASADEWASLSCGAYQDEDGWTALPQGVTCDQCRRLLSAFAAARAGEPSSPERAAPSSAVDAKPPA